MEMVTVEKMVAAMMETVVVNESAAVEVLEMIEILTVVGVRVAVT